MNIVWEEWGRFIWWTGQNAGAIQALSGVGILLLTAGLTYVTCKYVRLTSAIANLTRSQLEYDLLPKVALPKFDIDASSLLVRATIRNAGSRPFRVISIGIACFDAKAEQPLYPRMELSEYRDAVLAPGSDLSIDAPFGLIVRLNAPEHANATEALRRYHVWLELWCCDLGNQQDHTYIYRADTHDVLYYKGKITPEQLNERFTIAANHGIKIPDILKRH